MKTFFLNDILTTIAPNITCIGVFDGVHLGHKFVLSQLVEQAKSNNLKSLVLTFDTHPKEIIAQKDVKLITSLEERLLLIKKFNIDYCVVIPFSIEFAHISAYNFMKNILKEKLNSKQLLIGYDNKFGSNRTETFYNYKEYGEELGMEVVKLKPYNENIEKISSSIIREYIENGNLVKTSQLLGRHYSLTGIVVKGRRLGRTINFPTANIQPINNKKIIPQNGVYSAKVTIEKCKKEYIAMVNIGTCPTVNGKEKTIETHIINFHDDIYNKKINISFIEKIREEKKFSSIHLLKKQLEQDKALIINKINIQS